MRHAVRRLTLILLVIAVVGLAFGLIQARLTRLPAGPVASPQSSEWVGAIHVHTTASDGSGTVAEVAEVASQVGLDFLMLTDHDTRAMPRAEYRSGVLVSVGEEVGTDEGHLLVLGVGENWKPEPHTESAEVILGRAGEAGALTAPAHPHHPRRPWDTPEIGGFGAIEIWNADTEWRDDGFGDWIGALIALPVNAPLAMLRLVDRPARNLALLDALNETVEVSGLCAVDAHARIDTFGDRYIAFPSYPLTFRLLKQHVLLPAAPSGDPERDELLLVDALRDGRSYCSVGILADARGLRVEVASGGRTIGLGERVAWQPGATLRVVLPEAGERAEIRVFRDGGIVSEATGRELELELPGPGDYRVEADLPLPGSPGSHVPWIITNHVRVTPS